MPNIPGSIPVSGFIAPTDATDTYPTHEDKWGKGGHRTVDTILERDNITAERRVEGMTCYVIATGISYILDGGIFNINWGISPGSTTHDARSFTAGQNINGNRALVLLGTEVFHMDSSNPLHCGKGIGVSLTSALLGAPIEVVISGEFNTGSVLVSGENYWSNTVGQLVATPPVVGFTQVIGKAVSNTNLVVELKEIIELI